MNKFSLQNVISGRILDPVIGWTDHKYELSDTHIDNFVSLFGHGCRQETKKALRRAANNNFQGVKSCGILGRVEFNEYNEGDVTYCAGQDYPYEIGIVRNWIKKFY